MAKSVDTVGSSQEPPGQELAPALDPIPAAVLDAAKGAYRSIFAWELAEITFDSLVDASSSEVVRGTRDLRFAATEVTVDLRISSGADGCRIDARVDPPRQVTVEVDGVAGTGGQVTPAGTFSVTGVGRGRARFILPGVDDATEIRTDWVRI